MKKKNLVLRRVIPIAAAFLLVLTGIVGVWQYRLQNAVSSTVSLDVNPSVEIKVNKNEQVLAVDPRNEDAKIIIGTMDFKGSDLDVTVNALIGSMLQKGYITELANSILISVDHKDAAEAARLQKKLAAEVENLLHTDTFDGAVLSQTVQADDAVAQQAEISNISTGKAQLINRIIELNPQRTFEELAPLSINELNLLISGLQPQTVTSTGSASQKGYIGSDKAKEIALNHAGLSEIYDLEIDLDYEKGAMCYEVDFNAGGIEYEYDINATTGEIVTHSKEADEAESTPSGSAEYITKEAAKSAALTHAGTTDIRDFEIELDADDSHPHYEIEFRSGKLEYSYEIDASTGEILKSEKEYND
ncbi:MAG: PepSY domain-containing protein [Clostridia bacterium]|nr:PepSY domain-containing protein [Clostridia bacterium]